MTRVAFRFLDADVVVEVRDGPVRESVEALFPPLLDPSQTDREPDLRVDGLTLGDRDGGVQAFESFPALWSALEFRILEGLLPGAGGFAHLHASGAVTDAGALLGVGPSGSGKSTLALAWARAGLPLLGDDLVLVEEDGRVRGFPRLLKLHRDRAAEFGIEPAGTLAFDPRDPEIWWGPEGGAGWHLGAAAARMVAVPRFEAGSSTRIRSITPGEALRALVDGTLDSGRPPGEALDRFLALLEGATLVEIQFGDARDAAARLVSLA